jgi:hypothetical protein
MDYTSTIKSYYKAYKENDRETLENILAEDLIFTSSWSSYDNTKEMLDTIWPQVLQNDNDVTELEIFELENEFIVTYKLITPDLIQMVEHIKFTGNKISQIRVFTQPKNR